jgi:hypothetical protein
MPLWHWWRFSGLTWDDDGVLTAVVRLFVVRRHVDYGRVRSAICPA